MFDYLRCITNTDQHFYTTKTPFENSKTFNHMALKMPNVMNHRKELCESMWILFFYFFFTYCSLHEKVEMEFLGNEKCVKKVVIMSNQTYVIVYIYIC